MLAGLLEERVWLLRQQAETQPSFSLLEDLHWLLLLIGHVLVTGPSKIGSSKGTQPAWDSNFSVRSISPFFHSFKAHLSLSLKVRWIDLSKTF